MTATNQQKAVITDVEQLPDRLTVSQVASWLQLSTTAIYSLATSNRIPHARICRPGSRGGRGILRFDKKELLRWWEEQKTA